MIISFLNYWFLLWSFFCCWIFWDHTILMFHSLRSFFLVFNYFILLSQIWPLEGTQLNSLIKPHHHFLIFFLILDTRSKIESNYISWLSPKIFRNKKSQIILCHNFNSLLKNSRISQRQVVESRTLSNAWANNQMFLLTLKFWSFR